VSAYNLVLTTLSFLLVFRMNRAAVRFWDCRQMWGKLIEVGRQLTAGAAQHCRHAPAARDALAAWTCAFAVASKDLLRGNEALDAAQLRGIISTADANQASQAAHMPLFCAAAMRAALVAALGPAALSPAEANAPPAVAVATATHRAACLRTLDVHVDELIGQVGGMERIRATPLPIVYVAHLRTFLLCYLLFMPLVYISHWQWGTIPAMALVSFALLGVEGAAAECESPFAQRANHLAMDAYAAALIANVAEVLMAAEVHACAPWAQPFEAQQRGAQAQPAPRLSWGAMPLQHAAIAMPPG
jgi:putative membrane protein